MACERRQNRGLPLLRRGDIWRPAGRVLEPGVVNGPLGLTPGDAKPNGMILGYPVITSGEFAHRGSFINLLETGMRKIAR